MKHCLTGFLLLAALFDLGRSKGQLEDLTTLQETNVKENEDYTNPLQSLSFQERYSLLDREYDDFDQLDTTYTAAIKKVHLNASNPLELSNNKGVLPTNFLLKDFSIPFFNNLFGRSKYVSYFLYTRETINSPEIIDSRELTKFKNLKPDKPIRVIIHGWKGYSECRFSTDMRKGFLPLLDINLILVDWSGYDSRTNFYPVARYHVSEVGRLVAEFLDFFVTNHNKNLQDIHVIGHSLGAHIAGVAGKLVKNGKVGRITGLDPAGPEFKWTKPQGRLSPDSALFVDVIHTSAHLLGLADTLGHVDFFPNGGLAIQPGCGLDVVGLCSHRRSFVLYIETLKNPDGYPGVPCDDWNDFRAFGCTSGSIAYMGEKANKTAFGKYYLQTNNESPFWRGSDGIHFSVIY